MPRGTSPDVLLPHSGFCPSCHAKRLEEWGEWMREEFLLDVPHRQVVLTIPKMLRLFFKYNRKLLGEICRLALRSLTLDRLLMAAEAPAEYFS
ncbi:MAG: transposase zinc-binding domain-containing protein [Candidatus Aminicenantales bacterium]